MTALASPQGPTSVTLKRILSVPVEAYLLPVTGFPVPEAELEPAKAFLRRLISRLTETRQLSQEVFIQFENLQLADGVRRLSENGANWMPKLGLGVWPSRPAPTLWSREDFQNLDVGEMPRPLMYKVFRLSTSSGREQAPDVLFGRGTVMQVFVEGDARRFVKNARECLQPLIQEPTLRGFAFHVPLLDMNSLTESKDGQLESWLCGASIYVRESPQDLGVLVLSERPLQPVLAGIGGIPSEDQTVWTFMS